MKRVIIVRYDEIALKSRFVRNRFISVLISHIKKIVSNAKVKRAGQRILIYSNKHTEEVSKVFGVSSSSLAIECKQDINEIIDCCLSIYKGESFKINCKRADKNFPLTSQEINRIVGQAIADKGGKVELKHPKQTIGIELFNGKAYVFDNKYKGFGGLPVGTQGKALAIVKNKRDVIAVLMMMKRGVLPIVKGDVDEIRKIASYINIERFENQRFDAVIVGYDLNEIDKVIELKKRYKKPILTPLIVLKEEELLYL